MMLPEGSSLSNWEKPGGKTGMVVLGLLGAGGLMLFYKALPFLITLASNTLYLGLLLGLIAGIIYLHITEIRKISGATAVEIEYDGKQQFVTWKAPDGRTYSYNASYAPDKSNSVTLYYKGTDYRNGIIKTDVASWIKFYAAFTVIIGGLIFWIYKIFHKKKHVISK